MAGLLTTLALLGLAYLASVVLGVVFAPYDLADILIRITPGQVATEGIETLGALAKILVKLAAIALVLLLGGGLGAAVGRMVARRGMRALPGARTSAGLALFAALLGLALLNPQPARPDPLRTSALLTLFVLSVAWSFALEKVLRGLLSPAPAPITAQTTPTEPTVVSAAEPASPAATPIERRAFLIKSGATLLTVAAGSAAMAELLKLTQPSAEAQAQGLPAATSYATEQPVASDSFSAPAGVRPRITPQENLYNVSSRILDPNVDVATYTLKIEGNVDRPLTLTLDQLQRLPRVQQTSTLQCISNEVGGDLVGNCTWNGARLADLLAEAGLRPGSQRVVLYGADGYVDSIDLADALKPTTLIVYGIDDQALTVPHGYPVRLIVPNIYGMKNVKWLQRIDVITFDFQGYWQERGWDNPALVKTTSVIDTHGSLALEQGVVPLGGIALAGSRGIQQVEVKIDDGAWNVATLEPEHSPLQWRRWRWDWPAAPGNHLVTVRAIDGAGELQTDRVAAPHPDGASGYHAIRVKVQG
jgi:DMSO/TMAO reductase YedYZ molybdopterin-dependent catalytic subunit